MLWLHFHTLLLCFDPTKLKVAVALDVFIFVLTKLLNFVITFFYIVKICFPHSLQKPEL